MEEIAPGVMHWQAPHPRIGVDVSSYWLPELRTLLDPLAVPDEVEGVQHILLSCRHHVRDSLEVRTRFGAVVRAPRTGMHEFEEDTPSRPRPAEERIRPPGRRARLRCPAARPRNADRERRPGRPAEVRPGLAGLRDLEGE